MATVKVRMNNGKLSYFSTDEIVRIEQTGGQGQNAKFFFTDGKTESIDDLDVEKVEQFIEVSIGKPATIIDLTQLQPDP